MKRNSEGKSPNKSKMTVMLLQIEGADETIQEGFKALETALNKIGPQIIVASNNPAILSSQQRFSQPTIHNSSIVAQADEQGIVVQEECDSSDGNVGAKPLKKRYYSTPSVIADLDIGEGPQSFQDYFVKLGSPSSVNKRYLIVALWLKENRGIDEISVDHIYTVFRLMSWSVQKDVGQPLRSLKNKSFLGTGSSKKMYVINHIGSESVRKMFTKE